MPPILQSAIRLCRASPARVVLGLLVFGSSVLLMSGPVRSGNVFHAMPFVLLGIPMIVLAAVIAAPSIARDLVERVADFFTYSEKLDRAPPMYGIPQGLRKSRQYEEALAKYEEIAEAYPDELKPHLEMIDIAQSDLRDAQRAERIYQRALLEFSDEESRQRLARQMSGVRLRAQ